MAENRVSYSDLVAKMMSGDIKTTSSLNLRNESEQKKKSVSYIKTFSKKEKGKTCNLFVLKEIALPFDPLCREGLQPEINARNKFRPTMSIETLILTLKEFYKENPDKKELTPLKDWNITTYDEVTKEDVEFFDRWIVPQIFTENVVNITSKTLTGQPFGIAYRSNIKRDKDTGDVVDEDGNVIPFSSPDYPVILKIGGLYRACANEELARWKEENPNAIDTKVTEKSREIFGRVPVSTDKPQNSYLAIEMKLDDNFMMSDLGKLDEESLKDCLVRLPQSENVRTSIDNIRTKLKKTQDKYADFYEVGVIVSDDDKASDRGKNTKYEKPQVALADYTDETGKEAVAKFRADVNQLRDGFTTIEEAIRKSGSKYSIDDALIRNLCKALRQEHPMDEIAPFLTDKVIEQYSDIISLIYDTDADEILVNNEIGLSEESKLSDEDMKKLKAQNINDVIAGETTDDSPLVEAEEIQMDE